MKNAIIVAVLFVVGIGACVVAINKMVSKELSSSAVETLYTDVEKEGTFISKFDKNSPDYQIYFSDNVYPLIPKPFQKEIGRHTKAAFKAVFDPYTRRLARAALSSDSAHMAHYEEAYWMMPPAFGIEIFQAIEKNLKEGKTSLTEQEEYYQTYLTHSLYRFIDAGDNDDLLKSMLNKQICGEVMAKTVAHGFFESPAYTSGDWEYLLSKDYLDFVGRFYNEDRGTIDSFLEESIAKRLEQLVKEGNKKLLEPYERHYIHNACLKAVQSPSMISVTNNTDLNSIKDIIFSLMSKEIAYELSKDGLSQAPENLFIPGFLNKYEHDKLISEVNARLKTKNYAPLTGEEVWRLNLARDDYKSYFFPGSLATGLRVQLMPGACKKLQAKDYAVKILLEKTLTLDLLAKQETDPEIMQMVKEAVNKGETSGLNVYENYALNACLYALPGHTTVQDYILKSKSGAEND